jgi:hypothetical protein
MVRSFDFQYTCCDDDEMCGSHVPKPMVSVFFTRPKRAACIAPVSSFPAFFFLGGMVILFVEKDLNESNRNSSNVECITK